MEVLDQHSHVEQRVVPNHEEQIHTTPCRLRRVGQDLRQSVRAGRSDRRGRASRSGLLGNARLAIAGLAAGFLIGRRSG